MLTKSQKVLIAGHALTAAGRSPFTAEELVVKAWETDRAAFGLKGFDYPDSNATYVLFMGDRGLAKRGWLDKVGQKLYRLTDRGKAEADRLATGGGGRRLGRPALAPARDRELARLLLSKAVLRYRGGMPGTLTRADAAAFWGEGDHAGVAALVAEARTLVTDGLRLRDGRVVSGRELAEVAKANDGLRARFGGEA